MRVKEKRIVKEGGPLLFSLLLSLGLAHGVRFGCQVLLDFNGEHGAVGLHALVQLGQQLALLEVRQALVLVVVRGETHGRLFQLAGVVDVEALVLEELDDGVFGQVQLCRERVDGLLVRIQAHVLNEALQDAQRLHGDAVALSTLAAVLVLGLGG